MKPDRLQISLFRIILTITLYLFSLSSAWSMGMGWGDSGGGGGSEEAVCTSEASLIIKPGAMGAPVRLLELDETNILVADYSRFAINKIVKAETGNLQKLFDTRQEVSRQSHGSTAKASGKPLSVAVRKWSRGDVYFVGNDGLKTVDLYWVYEGEVRLFKRLFEKTGVQAVDMYYSKEIGRLFVVDGLNNDVKVLDHRGRVRQRIGGYGVLISPKGIAYDWLKQEVYVTDYGDSKVGIPASVHVFGLRGNHLKTISGPLSRPQGIDVADNKIYVADSMLNQVLEIDLQSAEVLNTFGCRGTNAGHLLLPMDVVIDESTRMLYVADTRNGRVTALTMGQQP